MRKIVSKEVREHKRKRNLTIISLFMLGLLVFGIGGYSFLAKPSSGESQSSTSGEPSKKIVNLGDHWAINFEGQTFYLKNSPDEIKNISTKINVSLNQYVNQKLYIDSNNSDIGREIISVLGQYASRTQKACYGPCKEDLPEKNCTENMVVWKNSEENKIYQKEKCIFIEGDMKAADAYLYHLMGFIK